jgi:hypothetical protein
MTTLNITIFFSLMLALSYLLAIPEASASLNAMQPIQSQAVDQGTRPAIFPIRISSSFINPFDSGDEVRLLFTSKSIPLNTVSFLPNPVRIDRDTPNVSVGLQIRSEGFSPGGYGFAVQATDEDANRVSSVGCLIIRPTNQTSCPLPPQALPAQQQPSQPSSPPSSPLKTPLFKLPSTGQNPAVPIHSPSLTGIWQANDGGTYYLRQIGNVLWWNGMSGGNDGRTFNNVFKGTITPTTNTIAGEWADVPRGTVMGYGTLSLKITSPTMLQKVSQTGSGFGAATWQKVR